MGKAADFKQYNYPYDVYCDESLAATGCGPCSVADILHAIHKDITPIITAQWLTAHGYASPHQGTIWNGINACLSYYDGGGKMLASGMDYIMDASVFAQWREWIKSGNMGILLMHKARTSYWTGGGHYIAIAGYDPQTDRYLVKDPASAERTGYHKFTDFAGDICCLYTSTIKWDDGQADVFVFRPASVKKGYHGYDASVLEAILYSRGLYSKKSGMWDNSCGDKLSAAIADYQRRRAAQGAPIRIDGDCGSQTWGDLLGTGKAEIVCETIRGGSHGLSVLLAQEMMMAYGYYNGKLDQSFGDASVGATVALQKKLGLPVTGGWDARMWRKVLKGE